MTQGLTIHLPSFDTALRVEYSAGARRTFAFTQSLSRTHMVLRNASLPPGIASFTIDLETRARLEVFGEVSEAAGKLTHVVFCSGQPEFSTALVAYMRDHVAPKIRGEVDKAHGNSKRLFELGAIYLDLHQDGDAVSLYRTYYESRATQVSFCEHMVAVWLQVIHTSTDSQLCDELWGEMAVVLAHCEGTETNSVLQSAQEHLRQWQQAQQDHARQREAQQMQQLVTLRAKEAVAEREQRFETEWRERESGLLQRVQVVALPLRNAIRSAQDNAAAAQARLQATEQERDHTAQALKNAQQHLTELRAAQASLETSWAARLQEAHGEINERAQMLVIKDEQLQTAHHAEASLEAQLEAHTQQRRIEIQTLQGNLLSLQGALAEQALLVATREDQLTDVEQAKSRYETELRQAQHQLQALQRELQQAHQMAALFTQNEQEARDRLQERESQLAHERDALAAARINLATAQDDLHARESALQRDRSRMGDDMAAQQQAYTAELRGLEALRQEVQALQTEQRQAEAAWESAAQDRQTALASFAQDQTSWQQQGAAMAQAQQELQQERALIQQEVEAHRVAAQQAREEVAQDRAAALQTREDIAQERAAALQGREDMAKERAAAQQERETMEQERAVAQQERAIAQQERQAREQDNKSAEQERQAWAVERAEAEGARQALQQDQAAVAHERERIQSEELRQHEALSTMAEQRQALERQAQSVAQERARVLREREQVSQAMDEERIQTMAQHHEAMAAQRRDYESKLITQQTLISAADEATRRTEEALATARQSLQDTHMVTAELEATRRTASELRQANADQEALLQRHVKELHERTLDLQHEQEMRSAVEAELAQARRATPERAAGRVPVTSEYDMTTEILDTAMFQASQASMPPPAASMTSSPSSAPRPPPRPSAARAVSSSPAHAPHPPANSATPRPTAKPSATHAKPSAPAGPSAVDTFNPADLALGELDDGLLGILPPSHTK